MTVVDPIAVEGVPVIMTDAYVEIGTANLSCLGEEVSIEPENKPVELTTFCGVKDYPGPVKWHFKAKLLQSFTTGATHETSSAALDAYAATGDSVSFRVRAYKSKPVSATNPSFEGTMIPQPYTLFGGAAGSASEVDLDWIMDDAPLVVTDASGGVLATMAEDEADTTPEAVASNGVDS
jgi:hypothetical protein